MKSFSNSLNTALVAAVILLQNLKLVFQTATPHLTILCVGGIVSALSPLWFTTMEDLTGFMLLIGLALIVPQSLYTYHWYRFCLSGELPTLESYLTPNKWRRRFVMVNYLFFFLTGVSVMVLSLVLSPAIFVIKLLLTGKPLDVPLALFATIGLVLCVYAIRVLLNLLYIFPATATHKFASLRKAVELGKNHPVPLSTMLLLAVPHGIIIALALFTTPTELAAQTNIPLAVLSGALNGLFSLLIPLLYATGIALLFKQTEAATTTPKPTTKAVPKKPTAKKKAPAKAKSTKPKTTKRKPKK